MLTAARPTPASRAISAAVTSAPAGGASTPSPLSVLSVLSGIEAAP
ncbi:hypothetical protein OIM90_10665 [Streptomyces sp. AD16]|nr:hypothetical protein NQP46_21650 [Streptomyces albus]WDV34629.1 hypothetical protein OIM90_10665 [Streptomyces sp. AD16]